MTFENKIVTFIYFGEKQVSISFYKGKNNLLLKKDFLQKKDDLISDKDSVSFIEEIILEFEKESQSFIKNVNIIVDKDHSKEIRASIKKKLVNDKIEKEDIENTIFELKKIVQENNENFLINYIRINNFSVDGKNYQNFNEIQNGEILCLEVKFEIIKKELEKKIRSKLSLLQIDVEKLFSVKSLNLIPNDNDEEDFNAAASNLYYDFDENQVFMVQKNREKLGFFEKLFHLFD